MKIVVASEDRMVTGHFGGCKNFIFFEGENGQVTEEKNVPNPGHKPGFLPNFLADQGAQVVIAGGMGAHAQEIFKERGVQVITGASGDSADAALRFVKGELVSTNEVCKHHHDHDHEHGHHHHHE
jgi:predicted Fe-Mo cluster-binding NifX family protein